MSSDASTIKGLVGDALALVAQNITTIVAALIIAFASNWILAFIVLAVSPILVLQGFIEAKFLEGFSADAKVILLTPFDGFISYYCHKHQSIIEIPCEPIRHYLISWYSNFGKPIWCV